LLIKSFQVPAVPQKKDIPCLTPRESQMIERLAQGMVPKEIAHDLGISYEAVLKYLEHQG
jgi:DNA-binding CsgD family transcriptional regulator